MSADSHSPSFSDAGMSHHLRRPHQRICICQRLRNRSSSLADQNNGAGGRDGGAGFEKQRVTLANPDVLILPFASSGRNPSGLPHPHKGLRPPHAATTHDSSALLHLLERLSVFDGDLDARDLLHERGLAPRERRRGQARRHQQSRGSAEHEAHQEEHAHGCGRASEGRTATH
eukprot:scaffold204396_cov21-Tisochrysis_lutea.AAC.1